MENVDVSLLNSILVVSQPCCKPITYAMVWLPLIEGRDTLMSVPVVDLERRACLPSLEMPMVMPCRSAIEVYLEFLPVMTALQSGQCQIG